VFAGGAQRAGASEVEMLWSDGLRGVYRKLVLDGERLAGAVLVGDANGARELSRLLRDGDPVPERLLAPPGVAGGDEVPDADGVVCSCNSVSRAEVESAVRRGGLTSAAQVGRVTRAGTGCGSCLREIEQILAASGPERDAGVHRAETLA
jgi:NAD(P)H-nitrite reductase large subunit